MTHDTQTEICTTLKEIRELIEAAKLEGFEAETWEHANYGCYGHKLKSPDRYTEPGIGIEVTDDAVITYQSNNFFGYEYL
jgi:hypothetical protein